MQWGLEFSGRIGNGLIDVWRNPAHELGMNTDDESGLLYSYAHFHSHRDSDDLLEGLLADEKDYAE